MTKKIELSREDIILAVLSTVENFAYSPVQIQKLFFLIDKKVADKLGGPFFNFIAYNYGPFDQSIYDDLSKLAMKGYVEVLMSGLNQWRQYKLTTKGQEKGTNILQRLDEKLNKAIFSLASFVTSLSFAELVSAVYQAYPEMKVNSIFRDAV